MEIKIYKIENKDGLYSTGGRNPRWTKKGKIWQSFGAVKLHLRQFCSDWEFGEDYKTKYFWRNNIPEWWVVVEITNNNTERYYAKDLYPPTEIK